MNHPTESFEQDMSWFKVLVTDNLSVIGFLAVIGLVGHKSFGGPDFGITSFHLFAIAVAGVALIGLGAFMVGRRADRRIRQGLQENGFTNAEIAEVMKDA